MKDATLIANRVDETELNRTMPCRGCGKMIGFIKTQKGKTIPVDPRSHTFLPDPEGDNLYVMIDGSLERGNETSIFCNLPERRIGFMSHFATCPEADRMRKRKR